MADRDAIMAAIIAEPGDDLHRAAFADWCEEQGDRDSRERAEFIRVQMKIARLDKEAGGPLACTKCGAATAWTKYTARCRGEGCRLRQREYYSGRRHLSTWDWAKGVPPGWRFEFRRGFVWKVRTYRGEGADRMLECGPAIVSAHPVERLEVAGCPFAWTESNVWVLGHRTSTQRATHYLPTGVFDLLKSGTPEEAHDDDVALGNDATYRIYESEEAGLADLSQALLSVIRRPA